MKIRELITKYKTDAQWRNMFSATISFVMSGAFLAYNLVLGIIHKLVWHFSISIYYFLLMSLRATIVICEKKWAKSQVENLENRRKKLFQVESALFLLIDLAMVVPIIMMVFAQRSVDIGMIHSIAVAVYTTYQVTTSIIGFQREKKNDNLSIVCLKIISLKSAIVAVLTLQNTLIMVNSDDASSLIPLTAVTSGIALLLMITISILALVKSRKK